jgi:hypothetical protein
MRSFLSAMVIAASLSLLVPDNGAQAVNAAEAIGVGSPRHAAAAGPALHEREGEPGPAIDSDAAWLLALGFLGAVMARRLRAD